MNRDDIIRMAKNTALKPLLINTDGSKCEVYLGEDRVPIQTALEHFADLVAAQEREECVIAGFNACVEPEEAIRVREAIRARGSK